MFTYSKYCPSMLSVLIYLLTYIITYLLTYILIYLHTYLLTYLLTYVRTYLFTYLLTYVRTYVVIYILTYLLIYSMEQSPRETNRYSASQEIPRILWNPRVHYRIHNSPPPALSWAISIYSIPPHPTSWRSILILSSHLRLGFPSCLFPSGLLTKALYTPPLFPYVLHTPPIPFFSIFITRTILGE